MYLPTTRRGFLAGLSGAAAGALLGVERLLGAGDDPGGFGARVVIARDEALTRGNPNDHRHLLCKLLDAALQKLTGAADATSAWRQFFGPRDRVGIKVNALGLATQPAVVDAIVAGLRRAEVPAENILIWDRLDVELAKAGFKLNKSGVGVQCRGTDAERAGSGYENKIETSGQIGSSFSKIVAEEISVLISVPVLKDHNLAGVSLGMKNFYGAIHNPNKYHDHNCDPYIVDVVAHRYIGKKWRLTVCDAVRAQYNAGPGAHPGFAWPFGGLIVGADFVALDAVATDLLEARRKEAGLVSLADDGRPARHIRTAAGRGLGTAELHRIERIEV
jgi:uncharacterized protein (DUF362 family)